MVSEVPRCQTVKTAVHHVSALYHVVTPYKVKVARRKQQQTSVFSFFGDATQQNGIFTFKKIPGDEMHANITSSGTVSFRVSAHKSATLMHKIINTLTADDYSKQLTNTNRPPAATLSWLK